MIEGSQKNARYFCKFGVFLFLLLVAIDQISKQFVKHPFLNNRFAFSLPIPTPLIYLIYLLVLGSIVYYIFHHYKNFSKMSACAWIFILAGAFSNILERILFGSVKDWIYILNGIFNLSDFYIIIGIILLLLETKKKQN